MADLKAKRESLDQMIRMMEGIGTMGVSGTFQIDVPPDLSQNVTSSGQIFLGMTIADAAKRLLEIRKRRMGTPEITQEIKAGGVHLSSADPVNTVGSVLRRREADEGDVVRAGKLWGLSSWGRVVRRTKKRSKGLARFKQAKKEMKEAAN